MEPQSIRLGDLIDTLYEAFASLYGEGELAALAVQVTLTDLLARWDLQMSPELDDERAAA